MRRFLPLLALASLIAVPSVSAQVSYAPMIGYDLDYGGFMLGVGAELPLTGQAGSGDVGVSVRPSVEYIFAGDKGIGASASVQSLRVNGDGIVRLPQGSRDFSPYGKLGVAAEITRVKVLGESEINTNFGVNVGAGASYDMFFAEGTLGLGDISNFRINAGIRF